MVSGVPVSERLPGYEILEHTADAGVVAHGATMAEAFEHAAEGMYALLVDPGGVRESVERAVDIAASDEPHLLAAWLLELLFLTDSERLLFRRFDVAISDHALHGRAWGEPIDPGRHDLRGDIKGVTRHIMEVVPEDSGWRVRVLFDM